MTKQRQNMDGFISRRAGQQLGDLHREGGQFQQARRPEIRSSAQAESINPVRRSLAVSRSEIDESLRSIGAPQELPISLKRRTKSDDLGTTKMRRRRIVKWVIIAIIAVVVAIGGYLGYKALSASNSIFNGNILDVFQSNPLQADANGRTNILILGTSEDDPGHGGAYLTDSMMVMSIDQKNKNAYMFSVPRDLYVKYGMACNSGYAGKINEYFNCVNPDTSSSAAEQERLTKTQAFVGNIFGMTIQYGVHVNNTVIKQAVDAVGGVDVNIQGDGPVPYGVKPGSILDRNFDWRCQYKCHYVDYTPGVHHIDGVHALFLAMARGDVAPTYGLTNSNFDREKNQQKIILALKDKAVSTGTFSNLGKVTGLIDALGANLRTNFATKEIRTLMQLGKDIPATNIQTISLYNGADAVVKSDNINGASVVVPVNGTFSYAGLRTFIQKNLSSNPVTREAAKIAVLNGTSTPGVAQIEADKLTQAGFNVTQVGNAPTGKYDAVEVYQASSSKVATAQKLQETYKVTLKTSNPPSSVAQGTDFVIVIGAVAATSGH